MIAWFGVYAFHSTLILGAVWLVEGCWRKAPPALLVGLWRAALLAAILTASLQTSGLVRPLTAPVPIAVPPKLAAAHEPALAVTPPGLVHAKAAPAKDLPGDLQINWSRLLLALWLVGVAVFSLRLGLAWVVFHREVADRTPLPDGPMRSRVERLVRKAGLSRPPRVSVSARISCPIALPGGEVCLPAGLEARFAGPQLDAMMAHEIAHLVRRDVPWLAVAQAVNILLFFQPLNAVARSRMAVLTELAADDWAATRMGGGRALAECLSRFVEDACSRPIAAFTAPMATQSLGVVRRVERLLQDPQSTGVLGKPIEVGLVLGVVGLAMLLPGVSTQAAPQPISMPVVPAAQAAARPVGAPSAPHPSAKPALSHHKTLDRLEAAMRIGWDSKTRVALEAINLSPPLPEEVFAAYLDAAETIDSDSEMRRALMRFISNRRVSKVQIGRAIQIAGRRIDSDSELSRVLSATARYVGASQVLATAYIEASETIGSDGEQADALVDLARHAQLVPAHVERLHILADEIPSRAHRVRLLAAASRFDTAP